MITIISDDQYHAKANAIAMRGTLQPDHPASDEFKLTDILAALSDPVRLSLLRSLRKAGEIPWQKLEVDVSNATLSYHLKVLRESGIIHVRREGRHSFVSLRQEINEVFPGLVGQILEFASRDQLGVGPAPVSAKDSRATWSTLSGVDRMADDSA